MRLAEGMLTVQMTCSEKTLELVRNIKNSMFQFSH